MNSTLRGSDCVHVSPDFLCLWLDLVAPFHLQPHCSFKSRISHTAPATRKHLAAITTTIAAETNPNTHGNSVTTAQSFTSGTNVSTHRPRTTWDPLSCEHMPEVACSCIASRNRVPRTLSLGPPPLAPRHKPPRTTSSTGILIQRCAAPTSPHSLARKAYLDPDVIPDTSGCDQQDRIPRPAPQPSAPYPAEHIKE